MVRSGVLAPERGGVFSEEGRVPLSDLYGASVVKVLDGHPLLSVLNHPLISVAGGVGSSSVSIGTSYNM